MQPTTNDNNTTTSNEPLSKGSEHSSESSSTTSSSKADRYRAMVARRGSTEWRGAARSKLAAGIEEGHHNNKDQQFDDQQQQVDTSSFQTGNRETIMIGGATTTAAAVAAQQEGEDMNISDFMEEIDVNNNGEETISPVPSMEEEEVEEASLPASNSEDANDTTPSTADDGTAAPSEAEKNEAKPDSYETKLDRNLEEDPSPKEKEVEERDKEEPEVPIIYKNWEQDMEEETDVMEDVELGGESELEDHIGEVDLDQGAFERLRELEKKERERQRKERIYAAVMSLIILCLLGLLVFAIVQIVLLKNNNTPSSSSSSSSGMPQPPATTNPPTVVQEATATTNPHGSFPNLPVIPSPYEDLNPSTPTSEQEHSNLRIPQNTIQPSSSTPIQQSFTGHLTPLQQPEISNGMNDKITVKFPVNMLVPQDSSVLYKVYDGPECSGGATDITNQNDYAKVGLYSIGPAQQRIQNPPPMNRMGLYLQWEPIDVRSSPLYHPLPSGNNYQAGFINNNPSSPSSTSSATIDLCVGLMILNSKGLPDHYSETYIMTSWNDDDQNDNNSNNNILLESVNIVPISTDST